jgi:hypothetical protein
MAAHGSLPSAFRPIPESIELLYREMVELGGGVYRGFVPATKDHPAHILFEDSKPSCNRHRLALPAKTISADAVRSALRRQAGAR